MAPSSVEKCHFNLKVRVDDGLVAGLAAVGSQGVVRSVASVDAVVVALQALRAAAATGAT